MVYILFIVFHVNSGSTVTTQEFNSENACKEARSHFIQKHRALHFTGYETTYCIKKGH